MAAERRAAVRAGYGAGRRRVFVFLIDRKQFISGVSQGNTTLVSSSFRTRLMDHCRFVPRGLFLALVGAARASGTPLRRAVHVRLRSHRE